jgi:hypothetical protein
MPITQEELARETELIAELEKYEHGQALLRSVERELDKVRKDLEMHPRVDNENLKRDFRFKLGLIEGLKRTLRRPAEARILLGQKGGKP